MRIFVRYAVLCMVMILLTSCAGVRQDLKYNYHEDVWETAEPGDRLKYNYMEDRWEYAR